MYMYMREDVYMYIEQQSVGIKETPFWEEGWIPVFLSSSCCRCTNGESDTRSSSTNLPALHCTRNTLQHVQTREGERTEGIISEEASKTHTKVIHTGAEIIYSRKKLKWTRAS